MPKASGKMCTCQHLKMTCEIHAAANNLYSGHINSGLEKFSKTRLYIVYRYIHCVESSSPDHNYRMIA